MQKEEKERRRALWRQVKESERERAEAKRPLSKTELRELFDWVDAQLEKSGCDQTLRHALTFIENRKLEREAVIEWLGEYGGFCDCEVIANVEDKWGEIVGSI